MYEAGPGNLTEKYSHPNQLFLDAHHTEEKTDMKKAEATTETCQ